MYKATVGKKYITITPKPKFSLAGGLKIQYDRDTDHYTDWATADVKAGQSRYSLPSPDLMLGRKVIRALVIQPQ